MLSNKVRIIGGKWRGRKINFLPLPHIRPTQDRIRETLFNWLTPYIIDAKCLDLFAGSGVLGFEALSRGAQLVYLIDHDKKIIENLQQNAKRLGIDSDSIKILWGKFPKQLPFFDISFDVVFLDPPFQQDLIVPALDWLIKNNLVHKNSLIYIETERDLISIPTGLQIIRSKQTKSLNYYLSSIIDSSN